MGGQRLRPEGEDSEGSSPFDIPAFFREQCPYFMAIGMTYEEYWHGDASLPRYYLKAHQIRRKIRNEDMWMQGKYIYDALLMVSPTFRDLVKEHEPMPYHTDPYPLTAKDAREIQERKDREKMEADMEKVKLFAEAWNRKFEGGETDG